MDRISRIYVSVRFPAIIFAYLLLRGVAMNSTHGQNESPVELIEDALVMGKLMEVDWTKRTARLDRFRQKPVKLRFGKELDETMLRFATEFVQIDGKGYLKAPDTDEEEWVHIHVKEVSVPYQSGEPKIYRRADDARMKSPFRSDEELQDFIDVIREGRHV